MISSSRGPSGVVITGVVVAGTLRVEPVKREKKPDLAFVVDAVETSDLILGAGEGALEVDGVA